MVLHDTMACQILEVIELDLQLILLTFHRTNFLLHQIVVYIVCQPIQMFFVQALNTHQLEYNLQKKVSLAIQQGFD